MEHVNAKLNILRRQLPLHPFRAKLLKLVARHADSNPVLARHCF